MTAASTHSHSTVTARGTEFVLSSDTSKRLISGWMTYYLGGYDRSVRRNPIDAEWGEIHDEVLSHIYENSSTGASTDRSAFEFKGSLYANTITYGVLNQSDVDTALLGVLHAEEFDPQRFSYLGEQQSLLTTPSPIDEALEFLSPTLISFSESLIELLRSEAMSFGVPILGSEWSVFADPEDLGKELVLGVTVNATSDRALEYWDKVSEKVSAKKQLLSPADQNALSNHLSVQIYWP